MVHRGNMDTWVKLMEDEDYFRKVCYADPTWGQVSVSRDGGGCSLPGMGEGTKNPFRMEIYALLLSRQRDGRDLFLHTSACIFFCFLLALSSNNSDATMAYFGAARSGLFQ